MNPQMDTQLATALAEFMRNEGMGSQAPPPAAQQSASLPPELMQAVRQFLAQQATPQDRGQTLGPQRGEPRNATRGEWARGFGQSAGSFGASMADPFGIPSAAVGLVAPQMRDDWRQYQGAAGPMVQLAGNLAGGFGVGNAMLRGAQAAGRAVAPYLGMSEGAGTVGGSVAGSAAMGMAPVIDYNAGAPGASFENAMAGPIMGAALPIGQVAGQVARANPALAAGAGAATALGLTAANGGGDATAQSINAPLDQFTQTLHDSNPALAAAYQRMLETRRAATAANAASLTANAGKNKNTGAKESATRADDAAAAAARDYETELARATDMARAANPTFRDTYGPILSNRLVRSAVIPLGLGLLGGAGSATLGRLENRLARRRIDQGEEALLAGNVPLAAANSSSANAMLDAAKGRGNSSWFGPGALLSAGIGGEMALAPQQWNLDATEGSPAQRRAERYFSGSQQYIDAALGAMLGASAYKGGRYVAQNVNAMIPGMNRLAPTGEASALATRVQQAQQAQPPPPPPVQPPPPVVPPAPPPGDQLPTDFETILRGIGENTPRVRGVRGPIGSNPAAPGFSYDAASNGAAMFRQEVADHLQSGNLLTGFNVSDFRRRLVEAAQAAGAAENQIPSARVFSGALRRLEQLIQSEGLSPAQAARRLLAPTRRGGFENFAIPLAAGGAAAVHHSANQPRGDDGRFTTP